MWQSLAERGRRRGETNPPVAEEGKGKEVGEGMHVEELSLERERETGALSGGKFDKYS